MLPQSHQVACHLDISREPVKLTSCRAHDDIDSRRWETRALQGWPALWTAWRPAIDDVFSEANIHPYLGSNYFQCFHQFLYLQQRPKLWQVRCPSCAIHLLQMHQGTQHTSLQLVPPPLAFLPPLALFLSLVLIYVRYLACTEIASGRLRVFAKRNGI